MEKKIKPLFAMLMIQSLKLSYPNKKKYSNKIFILTNMGLLETASFLSVGKTYFIFILCSLSMITFKMEYQSPSCQRSMCPMALVS